MTARYLGIYDGNIFYHWTLGEWSNRIKGARLAEIDRHELAVQAAVVSGHVARMGASKAKTPQPKTFFDAKAAQDEVLHGTKPKKEVDFTLYNRMVEGLKGFDWSAHFKPANNQIK